MEMGEEAKRPVVRLCFDTKNDGLLRRTNDIDLSDSQYQRRLITAVDPHLPSLEE